MPLMVGLRTPLTLLLTLVAGGVLTPTEAASVSPVGADFITEAITHKRVFGEPLVPVGATPSTMENRELMAALDAYLRVGDPQAVALLEGYLDRFPNSPWAPSLLMNLGSVYRREGRLAKAAEAWEKAWDRARVETTPAGVTVANLSGALLADLWVRVGTLEPLTLLLKAMEPRPLTGPSASLVAAARRQLQAVQNDSSLMGRCGPLALVHLAVAMGRGDSAFSRLEEWKAGPQGASLAELRAWGQECGLCLTGIRIDGTIPVPALVYWRTGHFATLTRKEGDRYLAQDFPSGEDTWLSEDVVRQEAGRYALVPTPAANTFEPAGEMALAATRGTGTTDGWKDGVPNSPRCQPPCEGGAAGPGMAVYSFQAAGCTLKVQDTPLWYAPPVGPPVAFHLSFNQMESLQAQTFTYWNLGPKWTSDWFSFVQDDPANPGQSVSVFQRGGGTLTYSGYNATSGAFAPNQYVPDALVRVSASSYTRTLPDGSKELFSLPTGAISPRMLLLTAILDPAGNALTLSYDSTFRLVSVTDALGQVTTLSYGLTADPLKVTAVTDPFGRSATFTYAMAPAYSTYWSSYYQLGAITDMGGLTSSFTYYNYGTVYGGSSVRTNTAKADKTTTAALAGATASDCRNTMPVSARLAKFTSPSAAQVSHANAIGAQGGGGYVVPDPPQVDMVSTLTTPYGTTTFQYGDNGTDRWIQATDPLGQTERAEYHNVTSSMPTQDAVAPPGFGNTYLLYRNTFYWDKVAMAQGAGDWTQAKIWHWLHTPDGYTSSTLESLKNPLDNRIWYGYPGQNGTTWVQGTSNLPSTFARVLDDGTIQTTLTQYNSLGRPTQITDPAGRITAYSYATNQVDLLTVTNATGGQGEVLSTMTYNAQHRPLTVTDAAGQTTVLTYNGAGQPISATDPLGNMTVFAYQGGYLQRVSGASAGATTSYTYDDKGRVDTITDPTGRTVGTDYDNLNRPTRRSYSDSTHETWFYSNLDLIRMVDRKGRTTQFSYNPLRQLTEVQDSQGRTTQLGWCLCGALEELVDPLGNVTTWTRDLQGRVVAKYLSDLSQTCYTYDSAGRLTSRSDPKNQTTHYVYTVDDKLAQVSYSGAPVPSQPVTYLYDPVHPRLATMTDRFGMTAYSYFPVTANPTLGAGRLASVIGPFPNSEIDYTYDELGRVTARSIAGVAETRVFDAVGRTSTVSNPLGNFQYSYVGGSNLLAGINLPNGQTTILNYFDATQDYRLKSITNQRSDQSVISAFGYTYDAAGMIATWSRQADAAQPTVYTFQYDGANQVLSAVLQDAGGNNLKAFAYGYDLAGNRTSEQVDGLMTTTDFNNVNQLVRQRSNAATGSAHASKAVSTQKSRSQSPVPGTANDLGGSSSQTRKP